MKTARRLSPKHGWVRKWPTVTIALSLMTVDFVAYAASSTVIAESGDWRAFKSDNSCLIGTGSGTTVGLLYFPQEDSFALDVTSPTPWQFSGGDPVIRVLIDGHLTFSSNNGASKNNVIQFVMSHQEGTRVLNEMAQGDLLYVAFPSSNTDLWVISLRGSQSVISAMSRCIADIQTSAVIGDEAQGSSRLPAWSAATKAAGAVLGEATIQLRRLNEYIKASHDASAWMQFAHFALALNSSHETLDRCIERNCNDFPQSEIDTFRRLVTQFDTAMTAKGIPQISQK